jgi:hypothetical protein
MAPVFAHIGHLLVDLPLFGGPPAMLAAALAISTRRARREERAEN